MKRIETLFKQSKVFAAYITAGDGSLAQQLDYIRALQAGGVNLLEIGVPFSDPIADGVVIQRAMHRALSNQTTLTHAMELIRAVRVESEIPIILFTYYNPIFNAKQPDILQALKTSGVDGILIIDLPFFEASDHLARCQALDLAPIAAIAPTTPDERLAQLAEQGRGFLYYACQKGTTGVRQHLPDDMRAKINHIKNLTELPVIVGFGIASLEAAQAVIDVADGFVVGSYFIEAMESGISANELMNLAKNINPKTKVN